MLVETEQSLDTAIELASTTAVELVSRGDSPAPGAIVKYSMTSFFSDELMAEAFSRRNWSLVREADILMDIAEDGDNKPADKMAALAMLHNRRREALELSGKIRSRTVQETNKTDTGHVQLQEKGYVNMASQSALATALTKLTPNGEHPTDGTQS